MMRKRNSDDRIRELERLVVGGDLEALIQLHQERKRTGQKRTYWSGVSHLVDVPRQGQIMIEPQDERTIYIRFGTVEGIGGGPDYSRERVALAPIVIRGIPHHGSGHFGWYEEEDAFVPLGPVVPGRTYREDWMRHIQRSDNSRDASPAAKRAIVDLLTPIVNQWAAEHRREMLEAEAGKANNAVESADGEVEKVLEALRAAQDKLAAALSREFEAQRILREMP